ncbi:MAG: ribosomal subunit interface protein [Dehalococcoidia bacterium]|nr:ribosomal subunit interface protein [Dehalococcoidia bacterium]MCB9487073.1 ribosomal subunit interface protein [Thermoflexaceae bacterium]
MQIQVETDSNIEGSAAMIAHVTGVMERALSRTSDRITTVSVHLRDENSDKKGGIDDIRCLIEAALDGYRPIAVTEHAATWEQALTGAAGKLADSIESTIRRLRAQERARTDPPLSGVMREEES